jgi:hypothetical protein
MEETGGPSTVTVRRDDSPRWTAQMDGHTGSQKELDRTPPTGRLTVNRPALTDYCGFDQQI